MQSSFTTAQLAISGLTTSLKGIVSSLVPRIASFLRGSALERAMLIISMHSGVTISRECGHRGLRGGW